MFGTAHPHTAYLFANKRGTPRILELVRYRLEDVQVKGAWTGPAALELFQHVTVDVAKLPVLEVISASHFIADLTLGMGEVVFDYLEAK